MKATERLTVRAAAVAIATRSQELLGMHRMGQTALAKRTINALEHNERDAKDILRLVQPKPTGSPVAVAAEAAE